MRVLLLFALFYCGNSAPQGSYQGFKVFRMLPTTDVQNSFLEDLVNKDSTLDFWAEPNPTGIPVDVMVPPQQQYDFTKKMEEMGLNVEVFIEDVQDKIDAESVQKLSRAGFSWSGYYNLNDIYTWMDSLPSKYPGKITVMSAGSTFQGRDIKAVKISFGEGRRAVFLEGGMHAREWVSPATVTYLINELLTSQDPAFRQMAESFDWYAVPVANPDGYYVTHLGLRLWRKTRSDHSFFCKGADPNRNWDFHWGEEGTSNNACSDTYGGPNAFSEQETRTLAHFISSIGNQIDMYLAFHSYSQLLLMPYGHTKEHLDNYDDVFAIGNVAAQALAKKYGTSYKVGNIAETIYKASGSSMDWVKNKFQVPVAFTYELRDQGKYGFLLPAKQIIPNCEEVVDSVVAMFQEAARRNLFKQNKPAFSGTDFETHSY